MLRNKKKFIALAIFLIMSFVMFASANPSGESSLTPDDNKPIVNPDNKTDETDQGETDGNEETNNNGGTGTGGGAVVRRPKELADTDVLGITFDDKEVEYDGNDHSIKIGGILPTGVTVSYDIESESDAGEHTITATLSGTGNYTGSLTKTATLKISKKEVAAVWSNLEFTYDGTTKTPTAHFVDVKGNETELDVAGGQISAGDHEATATTKNPNYILKNNTSNFKINPKSLDELSILGVTFDDKTVVYDGNKHNIEIEGELPEGVTVEYAPEDNVDAGEYDITATFSGTGNYNGSFDEIATLTISKKEVAVVWSNLEFTYNGKEQKPTAHFEDVDGSVIPLEVTGGQISAGTYDATAINKDDNYTITNDTKEFIINPKVLNVKDIFKISFKNKTVTYNGKPHSIKINGKLPTGVTVQYNLEPQVNAGKYEITATFIGSGNYTGELTKKATLTINKKSVIAKWNDLLFTYNGKEQKPKAYFTDINNKKVELTVIGGKINAGGPYKVTASITDLNYRIINNTSYFVILPKKLQGSDISKIKFEDKTVIYNGKEHNILIEGTLPTGITVKYNPTNKVDAGKYEITATFIGSENYIGKLTKTATLIISKKEVNARWDNLLFIYDGSLKTPTAYFKDIKGINIPLDVTGGQTNAGGPYTATATSENNNYTIKNNTKSFRIMPKLLTKSDISGIEFNNKEVDYDGKPHSIEIEGTLPTGVTVEYIPKSRVNAGEYTMTALFSGSGNYFGLLTKTAKLKITKKLFDYKINYYIKGTENNVPGIDNQVTGKGYSGQIISIPTPTTNQGYKLVVEQTLTLTVLDDNSATKDIFYEIDEAQWATITFVAGANGTFNTTTIEFKVLKTYSLNAPEQTNVDAPTPIPTGGYIFDKWNPIFAMSSKVVEDTEYVAQYIAKNDISYKVKHYQQNIFDDDYTEIISDAETKIGTTNTLTEAQAKTYTGFTAETIEQKIISGDETTVVNVYYSRNKFTLTFKPENGDSDITLEVKYGSAISIPSGLVKAGHTFAGWEPEVPSTMGTSDAIYTAKWNVSDFTITYDYAGGNANNNATYNSQTPTFTLEKPKRSGYTFVGWIGTGIDGLPSNN